MKKRVLTIFLTLALILTIFPATVFANNTINVYLTVNNKGVIATGTNEATTLMTNKEITVTDQNDDGKFTVDEVLNAAHALYCVDGYETYESSYGTSVTKLWGVSTYNTLFFVNGVGLTTGVGTDTVKEGDKVYASVNADDTNYADWYTSFNVPEKTVTSGQEFTLTLTGFQGMAGGAAKPVAGVNVGMVDSQGFTAFENRKTDTNGQISFAIFTPGTYYISANGTVKDMVGWSEPKTEADCPIMAPVCKVTVTSYTEGDVAFEIAESIKSESGNEIRISVPDNGYSCMIGDTYKPTLYAMQISGATQSLVSSKFNWYDLENNKVQSRNSRYIVSTSSTGEYSCYCKITVGTGVYKVTPNVHISVDTNQEYINANKKAEFTTQPKNGTWVEGSNEAFIFAHTTATGNTGYTGQWKKSVDGGATWQDYTDDAADPSSPNNDQDVLYLSDLHSGVYKFKYVITYSIKDAKGLLLTTESQSNVVDVIIYALADSWNGSGTQKDPYLITNSADLVSLSMRCADNESFKDKYFKMTSDITLSLNWTPIGTLIGKEELFFSGNIDGNGHTLTIPENGRPLLGYVRNSSVQNLNIYAPKAASTALVERYVVDNESEKTIDITNCTIKSGSKTLLSGFIGGYASGTNVVTMRDCTVEKDVVIGYDGTKEHIGSFGGEFNGYIYNCVSYATVKGTNYVGGIVANKGQTMGPCTVDGCKFYGSVEATGKYAGGICGSGYAGTSWGLTTAGNTPMTTIDNCAVYGTVKGSNFVGGILGAEACLVQCWDNGAGSISDNMFFGKISATSENATVGAIIGFMGSLNKYTIIKDNAFVSECGSNKGIGDIRIVDTNCSTINKSANPNTYYMDSSVTIDVPTTFHMTDYDFPQGSGMLQGYSIRSNHNRQDDPLGKDADTLTKKMDKATVIEEEGKTTDTWTAGSKSPFIIHIDAPLSSFIDLVVDGITVPKDKYTLEEGSIIVKISPEYLGTLNIGKHSVVVKTLFGDVNVDLQISKPIAVSEEIANTSDETAVVATISATLFSAIGVAYVASIKKKTQD